MSDTAERKDADERTWALSVMLAHISDVDLMLIVARLTPAELDRFSAVLESYRTDVALRDAGLL